MCSLKISSSCSKRTRTADFLLFTFFRISDAAELRRTQPQTHFPLLPFLLFYLFTFLPLKIRSFALSLHKISCTRKNIQVNLMIFRSFALSLHKISCTRKNIQVNLMILRSFALSLHKISCTRKNIQVNLMIFRSFALSLQKNKRWKINLKCFGLRSARLY